MIGVDPRACREEVGSLEQGSKAAGDQTIPSTFGNKRGMIGAHLRTCEGVTVSRRTEIRAAFSCARLVWLFRAMSWLPGMNPDRAPLSTTTPHPKAGTLRPRRRELFHGLAMHHHRKAAEGQVRGCLFIMENPMHG